MTTTAAAPPSDKLDARVIKIAVAVVLGAIMSILDTTVVSVAQNAFQDIFQTSAASVAWTMTGYTLALAAVIPLSGWSASRFGTRNVYLASMVMFLVGSVLCAFAWDIGSLVTFRAIQGFGGGMLMPVGMMIMTNAAGPSRVGSVMSLLGVPMMLGPICGPILGGFLIQALSWHWIFLINVPIGIVALVYSSIVLRGTEEEKSKPSFDFVGMLLLSPGLALFLYGVSESNAAGTLLAAKVLIPIVLGIVLIGVFIAHALRGKTKTPLIDLRLFKNKTLSVSVIMMMLFMIGVFGAVLIFPQYFIGVRGESTLNAGLLLAPQGIGAMLVMRRAGTITDRFGPGKLVLFGMGLIIVGISVFIFLGPHTSYVLLCGALFLTGLGMGFTMMPTMSAAIATLSHEQVPDGSIMLNVVQQVAISAGSAIFGLLLAGNLKSSPDAGLAIAANTNPAALHGMPVPASAFAHAASSFGSVFIVSAVLLVIALIPAYLLPRHKVATEQAPVMMH